MRKIDPKHQMRIADILEQEGFDIVRVLDEDLALAEFDNRRIHVPHWWNDHNLAVTIHEVGHHLEPKANSEEIKNAYRTWNAVKSWPDLPFPYHYWRTIAACEIRAYSCGLKFATDHDLIRLMDKTTWRHRCASSGLKTYWCIPEKFGWKKNDGLIMQWLEELFQEIDCLYPGFLKYRSVKQMLT
jgi:hypothetical protein